MGGGTHERFIIFEEKFAAKAEAKKGLRDRPVLFLSSRRSGGKSAAKKLAGRASARPANCTACTLARNSSKYMAFVIRNGAHPFISGGGRACAPRSYPGFFADNDSILDMRSL